MKLPDLTGRRFGRLVVSQYAGMLNGGMRKSTSAWSCICDCGNSCVVRHGHLQSGNTKSCGCGKIPLRHGHAKRGGWTKEYRAWKNIRRRCRNPKALDFPAYGGRGINICDEWFDSFESFLAGVGPAPSPAHSVDRIQGGSGYQPGNVRWATAKEQSRNVRSNRLIMFRGRMVPLAQAIEESGTAISPKAIRHRVERGIDFETAIR